MRKSEESYEDKWGKVRKGMKIDEESYKKNFCQFGRKWGKLWQTGENLGKCEESYEKRGKLYEAFM